MDYKSIELNINSLIDDKNYLIKEIQQNSDRLSFATRTGKSEVWNRFVRVLYDNIETNYVKCIHCNDIQRQTQFSGTSGLLKHKCQQNRSQQLREPTTQSDEDNQYLDSLSAQVSDDSSPFDSRDFYVSALQSNDPLMTFSRHRGKSSVWETFERILYNNCDTKFVKCKHCDDIHKHFNGYGTGALLKHQCCNYDSRSTEDLYFDQSICSENNPLNDKQIIKEMVENNDQRICFVTEKKKSEVWNRFQRIFIDDFQTLYVKCKYCECIQKHTPSGGTQGLRRHRCKEKGSETIVYESIIDEIIDSNTDQQIEDIRDYDEKDLIKHLTEENNTLKLIVEKCLNLIDNCLCVNKYSTKQRKEVNVLVNDYNKHLINAKKFRKISQNEENLELADKSIKSHLDFNSDLKFRKLGSNAINRLELYRKKFRSRQKITNSIKNKYKKRFVCDWSECGKQFRLERHLNEHRDCDHLNLKNHECQWPGCEDKFLRRSQLNVHILKYHSKARFSCDQCSYKTTYKALLLRHQRIHSQEKCIPCDWPGCDFKTNYEQGLKAHKLTHSGERPFRCSWPSCEWSFRQRHHLKAHMLKHTGEKPYLCQSTTCDRRFASRQAMRFHLEKVHK